MLPNFFSVVTVHVLPYMFFTDFRLELQVLGQETGLFVCYSIVYVIVCAFGLESISNVSAHMRGPLHHIVITVHINCRTREQQCMLIGHML